MEYKNEISRTNVKDLYIVVKGVVDGSKFGGGEDFEMEHAETLSGCYIGDPKDAHYLCVSRGIKPELRDEAHSVCSIGFCEAEQRWYGWSHRAMCSFGIGDIAKEGDCTTQTGWVDGYLDEHPEKDFRVPVGFEAKTLADAKRMAIAFADCVS